MANDVEQERVGKEGLLQSDVHNGLKEDNKRDRLIKEAIDLVMQLDDVKLKAVLDRFSQ